MSADQAGSPASPDASVEVRPRFFFIDAHVPEETSRLLRAACERQDVEFVHIPADDFDYEPARVASPGDMVYRAGVTAAAGFVEQHLYQPGVATFHAHEHGPLMHLGSPLLVFQRAGLPVPRWVHVVTRERALLRGFVERLGGFPLVLKFPGFSRGVGVTRIDSMPGLFSAVDHALATGSRSVLCAYVDAATHWRAIVVGDRVVSHYRNVIDEDDFRTSGSGKEEDYLAPAPDGLDGIAVAAVRALGEEFGGVDVLEHASGRLYLIESNNPCYFASGQLMIGTDIAGAMVEHLRRKAAHQTAAGGKPRSSTFTEAA